MGNITQLKQGSLNGLRKQTNECLDSAYNKGYQDGKKDFEVSNGQVEYNEGYNSAINDYNAMYEWLHDCFADFEKFLLEKGFYTDEKFLDGFVVGQLMYDLICDHDIAEVISEFKKWQEEKKKADEEIKVGDEVYLLDKNHPIVVTSVDDDNIVCLAESGKYSYYGGTQRDRLAKTGRHFGEVEQLLDKLRGE